MTDCRAYVSRETREARSGRRGARPRRAGRRRAGRRRAGRRRRRRLFERNRFLRASRRRNPNPNPNRRHRRHRRPSTRHRRRARFARVASRESEVDSRRRSISHRARFATPPRASRRAYVTEKTPTTPSPSTEIPSRRFPVRFPCVPPRGVRVRRERRPRRPGSAGAHAARVVRATRPEKARDAPSLLLLFSEKSQNETDPSALPVTNKPPTTAEVVVVPKRRDGGGARRCDVTIVAALGAIFHRLFSTARMGLQSLSLPPPRGGDTRRSTRTSPSSSPTASARKTPRGPRAAARRRATSVRVRVFFENVSFSFATEDELRRPRRRAPRTRGATPRRATRPGRTDIRSRRSFAERRRRPARPREGVVGVLEQASDTLVVRFVRSNDGVITRARSMNETERPRFERARDVRFRNRARDAPRVARREARRRPSFFFTARAMETTAHDEGSERPRVSRRTRSCACPTRTRRRRPRSVTGRPLATANAVTRPESRPKTPRARRARRGPHPLFSFPSARCSRRRLPSTSWWSPRHPPLPPAPPRTRWPGGVAAPTATPPPLPAAGAWPCGREWSFSQRSLVFDGSTKIGDAKTNPYVLPSRSSWHFGTRVAPSSQVSALAG